MGPPPSPTLPKVTCVEDREALEAYGRDWDALAASLPPCLPMQTHAWVATYLERTKVPDGGWLALLAHDGETLVGVLAGEVAGGTLRVPGDYHTEHGDLVLAPGREAEVLGVLLAGLRRRLPRVRAVELGSVREDSPTNVALAQDPDGWAIAREPAIEGSSFLIEEDVDAWFSALSKNLRSDLKRTANKIRKAGLGEPTFTFYDGKDAGAERLDDLMALEASGWKSAGEGNAIARDADTEEKYRSLARRYAARGMLEWQVLHLGDRLAAMHMCVRMGSKLMLLRQGFENELARYGVGNLLLRRAVEREHARGPGGEINLVTDYPWCRRWRMKLTRYDRVVLAPRRPLPYLTRILPLRLKPLVRRVPGVERLARWRRGEAGGEPPASR